MKALTIGASLLALVLSLDVLAVQHGTVRPLREALAQSDDGTAQPAPVQEPPEYPAGETCKRPEDAHGAKEHPCHCRDMEACTKPEDGQGTGPSENNHCLQWCHKSRCSCHTKCE